MRVLALVAVVVVACLTAGCCLGPSEPTGVAGPAGLGQGLLLYMPFEEDCILSAARGARRVKPDDIERVAGKAGQAGRVEDAGVAVFGAGNFEFAKGSMAFWVRPDWSPLDDTVKKSRALLWGTNFAVNYYPGKDVLFFMTGKTAKGLGYRWDYTVVSEEPRGWEPGQWHHVAITWDSATGRKVIYLDGQVAAEGTTSWIRSGTHYGKDVLTLGARGATGDYDEWAIWNRVLTPDEIAALHAQPDTAAKALRRTQIVSLADRPWPVAFSLVRVEPPVEAIVLPGAEFAAATSAKNVTEKTFRGRVTLKLLDFHEQVRDTQQHDITLAPGETRDVAFRFAAPERGIFKVAVVLRADRETFERDIASFAAWPLPRSAPRMDSFFGNHVNCWHEGRYLEQAARLGQGWLRGHNMLQATWWTRVQPDPGEFAWTYDFQLDAVRKHGMPVLGQLFTTPYFGAAGGPRPKPAGKSYPKPVVPDLKLFREYVFKTVSRYKGAIRHWEVWNEPAVSMFWGGTPEELASVCRVAYDAAKEADPDCVVMPAGFTCPPWPWHERFAKAGGFKHADAVSMHFGCPLKAPEETYAELESIMGHFRGLVQTYGSGHDLPIWSSEGGTPDTTWLRGLRHESLPPEALRRPMSWRQGAICTVQAEAIQQGLGVKKHFIYLQNGAKLGPAAYSNTNMLDVTNAPRPKLMARVAFQAQVDGTTCVGDVRRPDGGRFWAVLYEKENGAGTVVLWWVGEHGEADVRVDWPGTVERIVDLMGNDRPVRSKLRVTGEPGYVHVAASATAVREALRTASVKVRKQPVLLDSPASRARDAGIRLLPDYVAPLENPASIFHVDLASVCNAGFTAGQGQVAWSGLPQGNPGVEELRGTKTWYGVPVQLVDGAENGGRSVVLLSKESPEATVTVAEKRCRTLYFVHAATESKVAGTVGHYMVHYADGSNVEIPIELGKNCGGWTTPSVPRETARVIPLRVGKTGKREQDWRYLRVWEWVNPKTDAPIVRIEAVAADGAGGLVVLAISGV